MVHMHSGGLSFNSLEHNKQLIHKLHYVLCLMGCTTYDMYEGATNKVGTILVIEYHHRDFVSFVLHDTLHQSGVSTFDVKLSA